MPPPRSLRDLITAAVRVLAGLLVCGGAFALASHSARPNAAAPEVRSQSRPCSASLEQAIQSQGMDLAKAGCGPVGPKR